VIGSQYLGVQTQFSQACDECNEEFPRIAVLRAIETLSFNWPAMSVVEAISQFAGALAPILKEATLSKIVSGEIGSSKIESPARHYDKPKRLCTTTR
jgi:hypothetical protein